MQENKFKDEIVPGFVGSVFSILAHDVSSLVSAFGSFRVTVTQVQKKTNAAKIRKFEFILHPRNALKGERKIERDSCKCVICIDRRARPDKQNQLLLKSSVLNYTIRPK